MTLQEQIIKLRKKNGWSQEELADKLYVTRQAVSKWESGNSLPDVEKIVHMSKLFGVTTDYLLGQSEEKQPAQMPRVISDEEIKFALFGGDGEITDAMYDEVKQFAAFVKQREAEKKE